MKVATPDAVLAVRVPPSVPVPLAKAAVIVVPVVVTGFPKASASWIMRLIRKRHPTLRRRRRLVYLELRRRACRGRGGGTGLAERADAAVIVLAPATVPMVHDVSAATRGVRHHRGDREDAAAAPVTAKVTATPETGYR
ncbi:MAG: hypothetical protein R2910_10430 [Gemmatimonadales bacterium]